MRLVDLIPDAEVLCALEPDELGLRMLPVLAEWEHVHRGVVPLSLQNVTSVVSGNRPNYDGEYGRGHSAPVELAVREAWAWLEGSALLIAHSRYGEPSVVRALSRRAQQLALEPNARRALSARRIPKDSLHPTIREDVWSLYHRGKYDCRLRGDEAVEVAVREVGKLPHSLLGVKLVRAAFAPAPNPGPLTDTGADGGEQVARMELFAGSIGSYKNPHSHRNVDLDDPDEAAEIIMLANHLLRIVDACRPAGGSP